MNTTPQTDVSSLKEELELHDAAMASTSCGISIADARAEDVPLIYVNKAFCELTGYPLEEVLGRNCRFLQADDRDQEARHRIRESIEAGTGCNVLLRNVRKDGTIFWNELILSPIHDRFGTLTHFVGVQNDVTEREEARRALAEKQAELEALIKEKDRMTGLIAHDIRGPLSNLCMYHDLITQGVGDEETQQDFDQLIQQGIGKALQLIDDLLDMSAITSGSFALEIKNVRLEDFFRNIIHLNTPLGTSKGIQVTLSMETRSETWTFDPVRIEQVVDNLLSNAFKYSYGGSCVEVMVSEASDRLHITITDQGQGIRTEDMPKLFQEFQTTRTQPTSGEKSHGLGLSICRRIVELHGGTIGAESVFGEGSTFRFDLPTSPENS